VRIALVQQQATQDTAANRRRGLETEEILSCDVSLEQVQRSHARRLFLRDRRPELYGEWIGPSRSRSASPPSTT